LSAEAGVVKGVVLEHASGRALARARVRLEPLSNTPDTKPLQTRAGPTGQFEFGFVAEGLYRLTALRDGYFAASYGQRRPAGHGTPLRITADSDVFTELRMRRMGAITGRVVDDNDIGIAGIPVVAYRSRLPLRVAGRHVTDDRGVYRIHGLTPGKYWVRTGPHTLEDGSGQLPTYGPESLDVKDSRMHDVRLDTDTTDANIRPKPGNLFRLQVSPQCYAGSVTVTLSSETGRRSMQGSCMQSLVFEGLAPAAYEIFAVKQEGFETGFLELFLDRSAERPIQLVAQPEVTFEVVRAGTLQPTAGSIFLSGRRQDMGNAENENTIPMPSAKLPPGRWEMTARAGPGQYVDSIVNVRRSVQRASRSGARPESSSDWHDVIIETGTASRIRISVSDQAGQIVGRVTSDGKSVPGSPVFLWPKDEGPRRTLKGSMHAFADTDGQFRFEGLPPGEYRLLATFDVTEVDEQILDEARAPALRIDASQRTAVELPLWLAPL
jgi:hypothetical protein